MIASVVEAIVDGLKLGWFGGYVLPRQKKRIHHPDKHTINISLYTLRRHSTITSALP